MSIASITLVIAGYLVLASLVHPAAERLHLPYTVLLAVLGVAIGGFASLLFYTPVTDLFDDIVAPVVNSPFSASVFLVVFLPLLLFHAALSIDLREIAPDWAPILTLAIVAVFAAATAIGFSLNLAAGVPLAVALLLGAIVATTDPAAVVAIFRELGAPARLTRLVEGESLLNDAAAIVMFSVLVGMVTEGTHPDFAVGAARFAHAFLGGAVLGAAGGYLFGSILPLLGGSRLAEVTLSMALPYFVYLLGEDVFDVSGVVAVVGAALTTGNIARVRLSPDNWRYLERLWEQTGFWTTSLVFVSASALVPKLLAGFTLEDLWLVLITVAAAFVSRAVVLFGLLPPLSLLRLSQRVSSAYKLAITWGGLRGALTLALALAVTENSRMDAATKHLVAVVATGFVLFTLLVNGLTLRGVIRLLQLDRLSPWNQALRNKVLALSLLDVRDAVSKTAQQYAIATPTVEATAEHLDRRVEELASQPDLEQAISDRDRIRIGLVAITNREHRIILDHHAQRTVSSAAIERLLRNTGQMLDAARAEGRVGYDRAAGALLGFPRTLQVANVLHRRFKVSRPLQREISIRLETLLIRRLALEELAQFADNRLRSLLGEGVAKLLGEVIAARHGATKHALHALRMQYPEYVERLEQRFLRQSGFRLSLSRFQDLYDEGLIGREVFEDLEREHAAVRALMDKLPSLDLGLRAEDLLGRFAMFAGLGAAELKALARLFRPRLLLPEEVVIRKGERGNAMYLISSGAAEAVLPNQRVRLGSGDFFGEIELLSGGPRQADVIALDYCRVLVLGAADFQRFLRDYPKVEAEIERVAAARAAAKQETKAVYLNPIPPVAQERGCEPLRPSIGTHPDAAA